MPVSTVWLFLPTRSTGNTKTAMSAPEAKLGELSHETIMDIIRQIDECGITQVSLTGR